MLFVCDCFAVKRFKLPANIERFFSVKKRVSLGIPAFCAPQQHSAGSDFPIRWKSRTVSCELPKLMCFAEIHTLTLLSVSRKIETPGCPIISGCPQSHGTNSDKWCVFGKP